MGAGGVGGRGPRVGRDRDRHQHGRRRGADLDQQGQGGKGAGVMKGVSGDLGILGVRVGVGVGM